MRRVDVAMEMYAQTYIEGFTIYIYDRKCVSEYQSVFKVGVDKTVPCCARMNPKYGSLYKTVYSNVKRKNPVI